MVLGLSSFTYYQITCLAMCIDVELPGNVFVGGEGSLATNVPRASPLRDRHLTVLAAFLDFFLNFA